MVRVQSVSITAGWPFQNSRPDSSETGWRPHLAAAGFAHQIGQRPVKPILVTPVLVFWYLAVAAERRDVEALFSVVVPKDHTVMAISGHSSTRMLERYTHPTIARKVDALETFSPMGRNGAEQPNGDEKSVGGRQEARTPDLRVANAALSQLS